MRKVPLLGVLLSMAAAACGTATSTDTTATDDGTAASALSAPPDPAGSCDGTKIKDAIVSAYAARTAADATTAPPPHRGNHGMPFALLGIVYDADGSGALEDAEQQAIESDFSAGCTAMHAKLVAQYDTDGDGTLSDAEIQAAHDAIEAAHPHRDGMRGGCDGDGQRPPPPDGGTPPADGTRPPRDGAADGTRPPPPDPMQLLVQEFDTDGDGQLSADEAAAMRTEVRARIVAGERPFAPPPPPPPPADTTTDTSGN